jgi:hypothetical protein
MINNSESPPIFSNSLNRLIFIDKEEYILSYKHNHIYPVENADLGKIYLSKKSPDKQGNYIQYSSPDQIFAKDSININVLNNDSQLINKIVSILEGKTSNKNESFKLEEDILKIIMHMKNGINLVIFTCKLGKRNIKDSSIITNTMMRYLKNKIKLRELVSSEMIEKNVKSDGLAKKHSNLTRDIENEEIEYLNTICSILNEKKEKIRSIKKQIDGDEDSLELDRQVSKKDSSFRKEDDPNQSQSYSLSDLL